MRVAWFVNTYPAPSQSFIRREAQEVEAQGLDALRYAVRRFPEPLADPGDRAEQDKTRYLLDGGAWGLLTAAGKVCVGKPVRAWRALRAAIRIGRASERGVAYHLVYFIEACLLLLWSRRDGVAHIHGHFGTNPATVLLLCRLLGGPTYSFTVHGPEEFDRPRALALGEKIRHARFVVAITNYCRSQLYRWSAFEDWAKVHIVHCGLDRYFLEGPLRPIPDVRRLVCVGRLCEQKGQVLLVEAIGRLKEEGCFAELVLVGDGDMRPEVEAAIDRNGVADRCRITGWASAEEVRESIYDARALVLPSFAEGLPVVLMEALALGRPVITTWIAGIPELVVDGETGFLVPPSDVDALAARIRRVLDANLDELADIAQRGAERVRSEHDIRKEARKLAQIITSSRQGDGSGTNVS